MNPVAVTSSAVKKTQPNKETYVIQSTSFQSSVSTEEAQLDPIELLNKAISNNIIGELQEFCVKNKLTLPVYSDEAQWPGANNTTIFRMTCSVGAVHKFGTATNKAYAKKIAAFKVLNEMKVRTSGITASATITSTTKELLTQHQPGSKLKKVTEKILYYPDRLIGKGATAVVYEGYFEKPIRKAAVKICSKENVYHEKNSELDIMRKLNDPNVVTYFITEDVGPLTYIVMDLAISTLEHAIANTNPSDTVCKKWATETTKGLSVLHEFKIVHRDLKPNNILIFNGNVAKLADFGISKELDSCTQGVVTEAVRGTRIWMPTEGLKAIGSPAPFKLMPTFDIFSLGLTIFYIMTGAQHLFASKEGESPLQIQANIISYRPNWEWLVDNKWAALKNLLQSMINSEPTLRCSAKTALEHPFYWNDKKGLEFVLAVVTDIKNTKQPDCRAGMNNIYTRFCQTNLLSNNWNSRLCTEVQAFMRYKDDLREQGDNSSKTKKYKESSLFSLLEFIRDYYQHYEDWNQFRRGSLKNEAVFGRDGSNYGNYFFRKFPELTTIIYTFFQEINYHGLQIPDFYKLNRTKQFPMI